METRKIVIIETKNQKKSVIMSAATTLEELKNDLRVNGIDYNGMTFYEGISKTELKADSSVLPHDINYKGTVTNELVFMLTNTNKKIKSGACEMSRADVYNIIKSRGLQDACKEKFGKNFTQCSTAALIELVNSSDTSKDEEKVVCVNTDEQKAVNTHEETVNNNCNCIDNAARVAISKLVEILEYNSTIEDYDKKEVLNILGGAVEVAPSKEYKHKSTSPYSDDEIDEMFEEMNI